MVMAIFGRDPSGEEGEPGWELELNTTAWRGIHELCRELCEDLLDESTLEAMALNDGAGPDDQATCEFMAQRFRQWTAVHPEGYEFEIEGEEEPQVIDADTLEEWSDFLDNCGGFSVS